MSRKTPPGAVGRAARRETLSARKRQMAYLARARGLNWKDTARETGYTNDNVARSDAKQFADREGLPWPPEEFPIAKSIRQIFAAFPPKRARARRPARVSSPRGTRCG